MVHCKICGSVMIIEPPHSQDGIEVIRARCLCSCRGSDIVQSRKKWSDIKERKIRNCSRHILWKYHFPVRTFECSECYKTVTGNFDPKKLVCGPVCAKARNSRITKELQIKRNGPRTRNNHSKYSELGKGGTWNLGSSNCCFIFSIIPFVNIG
jgi:hypothetical protein